MAGTIQEKAMDKIRDEMAAQHAHAGIQALGEHMTELLLRAPETAEAILSEKKTLAGAFQALEAHAKKQPRKGGCVVISDAEGFAICDAYFGIARCSEAEAPASEDLKKKDADSSQAGEELDWDALLSE